MKFFLLSLFCLVSVSAMAQINEVECEGTHSNKPLEVNVERSFPSNSVFKQASLIVQKDGREETFTYSVTARRLNGFQQLQYTGGGLRLEVDHWPDNIPRWGRTYRATVRSSDLKNIIIKGLECRFPFAQ